MDETTRDARPVKPGWVIVLVLALVALAFAGGWIAKGAKPAPPAPPPVTVTLPAPPPVVITVPTIVNVKDTASARRVDSLITVSADKDRARDSLLHALAMEREGRSRFTTSDPTGLEVSGTLITICRPLDGVHDERIDIDSIKVPTIQVPGPEVETLDWKAAVGIGVTCTALGVLLHEVLVKR